MFSLIPCTFRLLHIISFGRLWPRLTLILLSVVLVVPVDLSAQVFVVRDYQSGVTLAAGQSEVSVDYLGMNDTLDLLNMKESRSASVSSSVRSDGLGDIEGGRLLASYGLTDQLMVSGGYSYREFDVTFAELSLDSYHLSLSRRHNLYQRPDESAAYLFGILGVRHHRAADFTTERISDIDYLARKVSSRVRVTEEPGRIVIQYDDLIYSSPRVTRDGTVKDPLMLGLENSNDTTLYLRGGAGRRWERINIALFTEVGSTWIKGSLAHNLADYGVDTSSPLLKDLDVNLDRHEHYAKAGIDLYYETLFGVAAHVAYAYQVVQRDDGLNDYRTNHTVSAELVMRLNRQIALTLGGEYYRNHFNGHIPLLYNRYTQSTFARDYGVVTAGMTMVFGR